MPSGDLRGLALGLGLFRWGRGTYVPPAYVPTLAIGTQTLAGFAHESATDGAQWPAASPALMRQIWPILSADFDAGVQQTPVVTRARALGPQALDVVARAPSVRIAFRWRYQGLEALLACAMGYMPAGLPTSLGGGAYRHLYELSTDLASEPWPELDAQPQAAGLDLGEVQHVVDQRREVLSASLDPAQVLALFWCHRPARSDVEQVRVSDDGVERRAEVVAHVRQKARLRLVRFFRLGRAVLELLVDHLKLLVEGVSLHGQVGIGPGGV